MDKEEDTKPLPDFIKFHEEGINAYLKSKGLRKVWNYFLDIIKTDYFKNFIKETRKKYDIPPDGFVPIDEHYVFPPTGFSRARTNELQEEIVDKICNKYKLHKFDYSETIQQYIYYNKFLDPISEIGASGLFHISDVVSEKEEPFGEFFQKSDDDAYPIAIRISPYASQRDLIDFVKNKGAWSEIQFLQGKYADPKLKMGKVKQKDEKIQARNDFIYEHRNLPRKEIMHLVSEKLHESLDYGLIAKIISIEKKRRKEVGA